MHIYFLGICGTAMGNAALLMRELGHEVSGADTGIYPPMSTQLRKAGVEILEGWDAARLKRLAPDLVVVGNATSRGNPEVEWLLEARAVRYVSLPELLRKEVLGRRRNIVVAGTHGKTTTTCIAATLLRDNGGNPGWFVGGVPRDLPGGAAPGEEDSPFVIEGDEYDTAFFDKRSKFIQYEPAVFAINNIEFDHADIFRDLADIERTFIHGTRLVPRNGAIVANGDDSVVERVVGGVTWCPVVRVGIGEHCDVRIVDFREGPDGAAFTLLWRGAVWAKVRWALPGLFNARNAAMGATAAALLLRPRDPSQLRLDILAGFQGAKRRQERLVATPKVTVLEDFGHHPTAIASTLEALRLRYPNHHIHAAFEPRSNTAVRALLQDAFVAALAIADSIWLAPVHRGEKRPPEDRLNTKEMAEELVSRNRTAEFATSNKALLEMLRAAVDKASRKNPHLVVFFSNGSFDGIVSKFSDAINALPQTSLELGV
ncbi:MAG: Mur ligase domain-containing protein [Puniceicoccales bacterium]|jgi:UDP-N-acetylmuramate: L-alanyl-gamma-D-glutamyl-meso-diaminopimelate ligase|nr:Mur ligase domain-containing protein [Puniceicoccales bacterium]